MRFGFGKFNYDLSKYLNFDLYRNILKTTSHEEISSILYVTPEQVYKYLLREKFFEQIFYRRTNGKYYVHCNFSTGLRVFVGFKQQQLCTFNNGFPNISESSQHFSLEIMIKQIFFRPEFIVRVLNKHVNIYELNYGFINPTVITGTLLKFKLCPFKHKKKSKNARIITLCFLSGFSFQRH
jgi:hypothetical protein